MSEVPVVAAWSLLERSWGSKVSSLLIPGMLAVSLALAACGTDGAAETEAAATASASAASPTSVPTPTMTPRPTAAASPEPSPSMTASPEATASATAVADTATPTPPPTPEPGAAMVDVGGGRRLYIRCEGDGGPAVVIEDGWDEAGGTWRAFMSLMAETTRVCVYHRAGLGMSDAPPGAGERTAAEVAADLTALTDAHGISGPLVLVGWSAGGLLAQVFTELYPERVAGLVLVDSAHPEVESVWGPLGLRTTGDRLDWEALLADSAGAGPFGDLPVRIVVQGGVDWPEDWHAAWVDLLSDYLALSSDSELTVVPGTGHCVQCDAPEAVAEIVMEVVDGIRG